MDPMILACLTGAAVLFGVTAYVVRTRRTRNGK